MRDLLPFVVTGIATGAVGAGLLATGLVLTYRTTGILNFAHGAIATIAAYVFYWLHVDLGFHWAMAMMTTLVVVGVGAGVAMERLGRLLATRPVSLRIAGTLGVVLVVQALGSIKYGARTTRVEQFLPMGRERFELFGAVVTYDKAIVTAVAFLAALGLSAALRYSSTGMRMRAVVADPDLVAMQGLDPVRLRRTAWTISTVFAALSGVLVLPFLGLDSIILTFLVVQAFGAAAIGSFASVPVAFGGGVLLGVASSISTKYVIDFDWLGGLPASLPFMVLFVALLVIPRNRLVGDLPDASDRPAPRRAPARVQAAVAVAVLAGLVAVPSLVGVRLPFFTVALTTVLMLLSLSLLVQTSGQISLCHAAFGAIGAVAFSQLHVDLGIPWVLALVIAGLAAVPVGAMVAIPAIRLSGVFLALATFGFGILVQRLLYGQSWMFTESTEGRRLPRPGFAEDSDSYYFVVLAVVVLMAVLVVAVRSARLGRLLRGVSEAPTAVRTLGLSTQVSKTIVFCFSAYIAAIAGALLGAQRGFAVSSDSFFDSFQSLVLVTMLVIAPFSAPWNALLIGMVTVLPAYLDGGATEEWMNVGFGVAVVLVAASGGHVRTPAAIRRLLERAVAERSSVRRPPAAPVRPATDQPSGEGLRVRGLTVRFGGLVAVSQLDLHVPRGQITALVGPNGAGKTSTFNACSGLNQNYEGRVSLDGVDLSSAPPDRRGRAGLGRTFQRMQLADSLTVEENVALGVEARMGGALPWRQLVSAPQERREVAARVEGALADCGIVELTKRVASELSTGQRRLVELARVVAGGHDVLLLDEPSSGLDGSETEEFGNILRRLVARRGVGVLLVEHDIQLVADICDGVYVLDFGRTLFVGTPDEMLSSEIVRKAYLGEPADDDSVVAEPA